MKGNFGIEWETRETNGSRVTKFVNSDVNRRLEHEKGEGFHWSGMEGTSDTKKTLVLDNLEEFHQCDARSGRTIPKLATVSHHGDNTHFEERVEVLRGHANNGIS